MVGLTYRLFHVIEEFGLRCLKMVINHIFTALLFLSKFAQNACNTITKLIM